MVQRYVPMYAAEYARRGWQMFPTIDRVYVNTHARQALGWQPRYDFAHLIDQLRAGNELPSPLAQAVGTKGYHADTFADGPYPVA